MLNDENATNIDFTFSFYKRVSLQADRVSVVHLNRGNLLTPKDLWLEIFASHSSPVNSKNK